MVTDSLRAGGKERQLVELVNGLILKENIQFNVITLKDGIHYKKIHDFGVTIHFLQRRRKIDPTVSRGIYEICKAFEPDIIHSWDLVTTTHALPIAKILGIKFINGSIRNATKTNAFSKPWIVSKLTMPFCEAVITNSRAGLKAYPVPTQKTYCIHNGFDVSRIRHLRSPREIKKMYGITDGKIVGMVARFEDRKDYDSYIFCAEKILSERNDVTFIAAGDGRNLPRCRNMINSQFKDKIIFTGRQDEIESIIQLFDIGVLTTNNVLHQEGIPNSIMEYMALGKPVLATDSGGNSELVAHQKTGFLIGAFDVAELASKMTFLLENDEIRHAMGEAGRKKIMNEFRSEKMVGNYLKLYKGLINEG